MSALLELDDVSVSYGGIRAISDVTIAVPEGCVVALLGANGAGKTSTLRTISGHVRPERGSVCFAGQRIDHLPPHEIARTGIVHVPEGRGIFRSLTVAENLEMVSRASGRQVVEQAVAVFPALGGRLRQLAGTLSGGEQQMLALARAFVSRPRLLMLDEISMGLAPRITQQLFAAIRRGVAAGITMLLVEQYVDAALALADYAYVLEKGRIVDSGEPSDLRTSAALAEAYLGVAG